MLRPLLARRAKPIALVSQIVLAYQLVKELFGWPSFTMPKPLEQRFWLVLFLSQWWWKRLGAGKGVNMGKIGSWTKPALIAIGLSLLASAAGATTVYSNDFSSNDNGFTGNSTLTTSPSGNQFVYFGGAGGTGSLTLTGLTPNSSVNLSFDLYAVDSLDGGGTGGAPIYGGGSGDYFAVTSNSTQIFNQAFANYGNGENQTYPVNPSPPGTGAYALNSLGYTPCCGGNPGYGDAEYAIALSGSANGSGDITFEFFDNSNEGTSNEFYGIDNVSVTGSTLPGVPEPTTWALMMLGIGGIGAATRISRRKGMVASSAI